MKIYAILFTVFAMQTILALLCVKVGFRMGRQTMKETK